MYNNNNKAASTDLRTFYSPGISCLNLGLYNYNLSFRIVLFNEKSNGNSSRKVNALTTSANYEGASLL